MNALRRTQCNGVIKEIWLRIGLVASCLSRSVTYNFLL